MEIEMGFRQVKKNNKFKNYKINQSNFENSRRSLKYGKKISDMKITLFTSNNSRHIYLIKSLLKVCKCLNIVIESKQFYNGKVVIVIKK